MWTHHRRELVPRSRDTPNNPDTPTPARNALSKQGDHGIAETGKPRSAMNVATKSATLEPQQVAIPTRQEVP
jgi:hypothetical protein